MPHDHVSNRTEAVSGQVVQAGVVKGDVHLHQHSAPRPAAQLPLRVGLVPQRAASFQERATSEQLTAALDSGHTAILTSDGAQATVLSGLGGVGKTQLAADHAERTWAAGEVQLLVWVTAGSREAVMSSYADVATRLTGQEQDARGFLEWLAGTDVRWLVVLDDLQSPADLSGLWPPTTDTGRVVVTTRRRDAALRGHRRRLVEVGVFSEAEAVAYLHTVLTDEPRLLDGAVELVRDLGCLPLALAQAGAYLLDNQLSCAHYRVLFAGRRLTKVLPHDDCLPDEHRTTVAATWSLSVEQANGMAPEGLARPLLDIASVLSPNGIPIGVFTTPAMLRFLGDAAQREIDEHDARDGLACLHRLSLIDLDTGSEFREVRVHALVQRATREAGAEELPAQVVRAAADALVQVWPEIERDPVLGQVLRANTEALAETGIEHLWRPTTHLVLFRAGQSLGDSGLPAAAKAYFDQLRESAARFRGQHDTTMVALLGNAAFWQGFAGDPTGAASTFEELLADQLRLRGEDDSNTLSIRLNIAFWRADAGDTANLIPVLEQLLADQLRVLGPDHSGTRSTRQKLAQARSETGDFAGALAELEHLLADELRVHGPDHGDTLITRQSLAWAQARTGDVTGSIAALKQLIADDLRVLGPDHPHTVSARYSLACRHAETGDPAAMAEMEQVLADRMRIHGPDDPRTRNTRSWLDWLKKQSG
ncbi:NB-ARC domain-containing protein [Lentzea sp. BCCO 10_0856]|uniref:NB-ARC domain-containing protein n=1 Tax=Lentzea miocenica TaxID=3095431 RepID=A0ABU4TCA0_9PSEU|nr:tetratricopeptide repeat protein [Lentzea sp. BCCO 10_0856]MDX8035810.1 NB-ARC domain-containing protein [Lentzea sp. BCCO 10_0856]